MVRRRLALLLGIVVVCGLAVGCGGGTPIGFDGAILRYLRIKAKLSIEEAAIKVGLSRPHLGNIERGRRSVSTALRNELLGVYGYSSSSYRNFTTEDKRAKNIPVRFKLDILIAQMSEETTEKVFAFALQNSNQQNQ